jgi:hypothetical protein
MAAVTLAGCVCSGDPVTETAYATMASYPTELTACILHQDCVPLCRAVFPIGDAEIRSCELWALDEPSTRVNTALTPCDLQQVRGAQVRVSYVRQTCSFDVSAWADGDDGSIDDGSTDDGSTDDGSTDDGSTDDGSTDDGSTDDGSTDDGSTDDGSTDDGSTDDGSTDDGNATGDGSSLRHVPPHAAGRPAILRRHAGAPGEGSWSTLSPMRDCADPLRSVALPGGHA